MAKELSIDDLLRFAFKNKASDLHISAGLPPMIRVDGEITKINMPPLDHQKVHSLIYDIMNDKQRADYEEFFETDFSFEIPNVARFRVNAFNQNRGAGAVFRTIPSEVLTMEQLGMGPIFEKISNYKRGVVLVTGPTGPGKSTTLAAMINYINENYQNELNWSELSDSFNIPLRTLNRKLQEHTGLTPNNYLGRVRLCHASYLLSHSQDAVTDIAFSCGFNDSNYFSSKFHQAFNVTPMQYRKRYRNS